MAWFFLYWERCFLVIKCWRALSIPFAHSIKSSHAGSPSKSWCFGHKLYRKVSEVHSYYLYDSESFIQFLPRSVSENDGCFLINVKENSHWRCSSTTETYSLPLYVIGLWAAPSQLIRLRYKCVLKQKSHRYHCFPGYC